MTKYWYRTVIPWKDAFRPDWKYPRQLHGYPVGIWNYSAKDIFQQGWVDEWASKGVELASTMVFFRPRWFMNVEAHCDMLSPDDPTKLSLGAFNAVVGGEGSVMTWYDLPEIAERDYRLTQAGTSYLSWPIDKLHETDRYGVSGPDLTMVRVDVPHAVYVRHEPRWCISLRTVDMHLFASWEEMVDHYISIGILIKD